MGTSWLKFISPSIVRFTSKRFAHKKRILPVNDTSTFDMTKQISRVWTFTSDSNPNVEYEALQYVDGATSCTCKGWTRRVAADGSRSCKH
jgi:hypothetical protein